MVEVILVHEGQRPGDVGEQVGADKQIAQPDRLCAGQLLGPVLDQPVDPLGAGEHVVEDSVVVLSVSGGDASFEFPTQCMQLHQDNEPGSHIRKETSQGGRGKG